jgi:hypothetical protein
MSSILASYRWRRRFLWSLSVLVVVVGFAVLALLLPRGSGIPEDEPFPEEAVPQAPQPVVQREVPVTPATRREVNAVLKAFVRHAVARDDPAAAWDLATPALRAGSTRAEWRTGNLPVFPFPAVVEEATGWYVIESFEDDLLVDLVMHARRGTKRGAIAYQIELKRIGRGANRRWRVESIIPERVYTPASETPRRQADRPPPAASSARLSSYWFAVPAFILSLIVLLPTTIAVVNWRRGRRADKDYRRSLREDT